MARPARQQLLGFWSSSILGGVRVTHIKRALEEVLGKGVHRVVGLLNANVLQAFGQERHQVVLEVHANVL